MKKYKMGSELKDVPSGNKGLSKLPTAVRNKMGYKKMGGEKFLNKMMQMGGSMDMSDEFVMKMKYGGGYMKPKKMQIGGQMQARITSFKKK